MWLNNNTAFLEQIILAFMFDSLKVGLCKFWRAQPTISHTHTHKHRIFKKQTHTCNENIVYKLKSHLILTQKVNKSKHQLS